MCYGYCFFFNDTATTEIYTLSLPTLFRSDSDKEDIEVNVVEEKSPEIVKQKSPEKTSNLGLPMTEASEAWMDDLGDGDGFDDSDKEDLEVDVAEEKSPETIKQKSLEKTSSLGLPMTEASDAWMDDLGDEGGFDVSDEDNQEVKVAREKFPDMAKQTPPERTEDQENKKIFAETQESVESSIPVKETSTNEKKLKENADSKSFGLPMADTTDEWMTEDYETINLEDDSDSDLDTFEKEKRKLKKDIEHFEKKLGSNEAEDGSKNDTPMPSSEKRLSAFEEAQIFSCDDNDEDNDIEDPIVPLKEDVMVENVEETSWAFVAAKTSTTQETSKVVQKEEIVKTSVNPALIVEIIEKPQKEQAFDQEGYQVVKKNKSKQMQSSTNNTNTNSLEKILKELDQPIEEYIQVENTSEESFTMIDIETEDKTNVTEEKKTEQHYTLDVKVTTKETCLGRRLHQNNTADWKMDVQCVQKDTIPDIVERNEITSEKTVDTQKVTKEDTTKSSTLPRPQKKELELCLSPAWMRKKDYSKSTENLKSGSIFGSFQEKRNSSSARNITSSSVETVDQEADEEVYWRIKHKV